MNPGAIQFTRILTGPSSLAKALVNPKNILMNTKGSCLMNGFIRKSTYHAGFRCAVNRLACVALYTYGARYVDNAT